MLKGARVWRYRFIPAQAGNTSVCILCSLVIPVHPRAGGEHPVVTPVSRAMIGSSPRRRGTRRTQHQYLAQRRFIPAQAGNTRWVQRRAARNPVHPRAGGEHSTSQHFPYLSDGSSPRRRGTPDR
ncbi:Hypothetical protein GbCGDNIH1_1369 [Granulibacter bethesdensis CGDNIH1]|nr:Hypothetical protein GbCGDNIH1_1369 [Granulibacter bethesdensis CGDNIH1]APH64785.1 Hypothetical protein GbCGDNIH1I4_1369 [Granulibacter bethesdensis]